MKTMKIKTYKTTVHYLLNTGELCLYSKTYNGKLHTKEVRELIESDVPNFKKIVEIIRTKEYIDVDEEMISLINEAIEFATVNGVEDYFKAKMVDLLAMKKDLPHVEKAEKSDTKDEKKVEPKTEAKAESKTETKPKKAAAKKIEK